MKVKTFALLMCSLYFMTAKAQLNQRFDNINYKAIYFKQACELIANNPHLLLLDVRSPGEYADTTQSTSSRIGRLKGAVNISIDSITKHFSELTAYKDKPILVYCSHSSRSRIVSKRLADSGFTKVYSLNGGMTEVNRTPNTLFPCKPSLYTTNVPYKLMGPADAAEFIKNKNNIVLDVRPADQFNGVDKLEVNNIGRIKTAINVTVTEKGNEFDALAKYKERPILVYDLLTGRAAFAAAKLKAAGFKDVSVLFDNLDAFLLYFPSSSNIRKEWIEASPAYKLIGVRETIGLVNNTPNLVVADLRPKKQFENKEKETFYNLGHIKNAVNFTSVGDVETYLKDKPKNTPILLYSAISLTMGMGKPEINPNELAKKLSAEGYTSVYLLNDGIYSVVWSSANVEGLKDAAGILEDHKGLY